KRANQWRRWSEDIIPAMIVPYLSYIQETVSLCHANMPVIRHRTDGECGTGCRTRNIKGACVFLDAFKETAIIACPCSPAPLQLLCHGHFPCAPLAPSLAVALETFLDGMKYKLRLKVEISVLVVAYPYSTFLQNNLRRRFSNAFHWYQVL
ncbi:hypothetical protein BDR03DRAFT_810559, partial [Suillus americanus]